eukprot:gene30860-biopygen19784
MDNIMLADLRRCFPMICGVFPVDSCSGRGVDELRSFLLEEALHQQSTKNVVSASLPKMIDRIVFYAEEHKDTFFVSREQLLFIMGEPNLTAEEQNLLIKQLMSFEIIHKLSYMSNSSNSDPIFILRPQQLADVLACVITKNPATLTRLKRLTKEGVLDHSDDSLRTVWGAYPEELWRCSDSSDGRLSIFIRLLHDSGLAYELLAGLRKIATDGGAWRNGAVLSAGVSYALLREERTGISVSLFGKNRSVRSVILITMLKVMQKFRSMSISDVTLIVSGRKWSGDDIKESLHYGHGILHSAMFNIKVEVHSLWMLFPQETKDNDSVLSLANLPKTALEKLSELQLMVQRAKTAKSMDFIVFINYHLQSCVSLLLHLMGAPQSEQRDGFSRPLWVVLKHETAALVKELLSDCFAVMRGNVMDVLPSGWELAHTSLWSMLTLT